MKDSLTEWLREQATQTLAKLPPQRPAEANGLDAAPLPLLSGNQASPAAAAEGPAAGAESPAAEHGVEVTSADRRPGDDDVTSGGSPATAAGAAQSQVQPLDWAWIFKPVKGSAAMRQVWPPPPLLQQQQYVSATAAVPQVLNYTPSPLGMTGAQRSAGAPHPPGLPSLGSGQHALAPSASVEAAVAAAAALETQLQPRSLPGSSQAAPAAVAPDPAGTAVKPTLSQPVEPRPAGLQAPSGSPNNAALSAAGAAQPTAGLAPAPAMANGPVALAAASPALASQATNPRANGATAVLVPAVVPGAAPSGPPALAEQPQPPPAGTAASTQQPPPEAETKAPSATTAEPPEANETAGPPRAADAATEGETAPAAAAASNVAQPPAAEVLATVAPPARHGSGGLPEQPSASAVSGAAAAAAHTPGEQPSMSGTPPASGAAVGAAPPRPKTPQEGRPPLPASWQEWQVHNKTFHFLIQVS